MRIGLIIVVHSVYPEKLIASLNGTRHSVAWHVYFHGTDSGIEERLEDFAATGNVSYHALKRNDGLSRSWNAGIVASRDRGDDVTVVLNGDLYFVDDGFDQWIDFVAAEENRSASLTFVKGREVGQSHLAGQVIEQGFACFAVGRPALDAIGFFDENFRPAYFEDLDYNRRALLAGLVIAIDQRVLVEHERSSTMRADPEIAANFAAAFTATQAYYARKWGGVPLQESYTRPFDDPRFSLRIDEADRADPYGPEYDNQS